MAVEVPLCLVEQLAPILEVGVDGESPACFQFKPLAEGTARAGKSEVHQNSSASRCLVWQLEGGAPSQLRLQEVSVCEERREGGARLRFAAPLLPAVSCTESAQHGGTLVAVVSADGALHTIRHSSSQAAGGASLLRQLQAPGAVTSVPLAPLFQRAGEPTALLEVGGVVCVGTQEGNLVCLPAGSTDAADAFVLAPTSGFGKMLGGFFGRPTGQAVRQLLELRFMDRRLLAAIHEGGQLRLWDLPTRRLVHSADLLPASMSGEWVPTLARLTAEPLDASTSILLVYFSPSEEASPEAGMLTTYEVFLEQRGEGAYKASQPAGPRRGPGVLVELGPRLQGSVHRLHDLVLENVALHTVGAWLLYEDAQGRRRVDCVSLAFQGGAPESATQVTLLEEQLLDGCQAGQAVQVAGEAWRALEAQLNGGATPALGPAALAAACADAVVAPGRLSRPALLAALGLLGSRVEAEEVAQADLAELKEQLPRWVAATAQPAGPIGGTAGGALSGVLAKWTAFQEAYAAAWQLQHAPVALLQVPPQGEPHSLLVARQGGMFSVLRGAAAPELALHDELPPAWQAAAEEELLWACMREGLDLSATVLPAVVRSVAGGTVGAPPAAAAGGGRLGFPGGGGGGGGDARAVWRAACRRLPLQLARLCGGEGAGFVAAAAAALSALGVDWRDASRVRSPLAAVTGPIRTAALGTLAQARAAARQASQARSMPARRLPRAACHASLPAGGAEPVSWAQLQAVGQLALLLRYALWSHSMALWSLAPEDAQRLESALLPRALGLLRAAAVAYWAAVTPAPEPGSGSAAGLDPADMVVALRIGDGGGGAAAAAGARLPLAPMPAPMPALLLALLGLLLLLLPVLLLLLLHGCAAAAKRARVSKGQVSYVAGLLLAACVSSQDLHVVRDLPDLQRVSLLLSQRLLCLSPSPLHAAAPGAALHLPRGGGGGGQPGGGRQTSPDDLAVQVAAELFAGRHTAQLAALQRLLPPDTQDMRLLFFRACSRARQIGLAASPEEQRRLEEESCSLFFRVAAVYAQPDAFPGQAAAVGRCVQQLLADAGAAAAGPQARDGGAVKEDGPQAAELRYYEALTTMYERMGRYGAAARCALAAARQVAAAMPRPEQLAARAQAQGRLWTQVFSCMLESGRYEEAYVALLSNEVAEVQLDCLHRLVACLCAAPRGVELLCRLPFAQNLALVRGGRQAWVPMLEEVVGSLGRRAAQLDLRASPQPYKVLADFHICRSNYQAAAGAMLAYARRLVQERPDEPALLAEAEHALAAAVSCLSLVERQHAWVADPAAAEGPEDEDGEGAPPVLTLGALRREYAVVRGHAALAAAMPGGERGTALLAGGGARAGGDAARGEGAEAVLSQLLALGLHDAAFQLAEAAFVGSQLTRALERCFASLAAACVACQLALGSPSACSAAAGVGSPAALLSPGGDDMDTDEAAGAGAAASGGGGDGGAAAAAAEWRRLKDWLHRHEGGEHRFRLHLVILDALLSGEPAFMLPPWLMAAFRVRRRAARLLLLPARTLRAGAPGADLGGALRVLMRHERLRDAAQLAARHLQHALTSVPSVGMSRTAQVYFPQAQLDELVARLGGAGGEGLAREREQVAELLRRVRGAARGQTDVIQQLYAH
ncbi:hypothetical protein CHLNCDRAFT_138668 [Chlorella variabilis]|uniref:Uncharacterized protein n=1 Tax=Chlorella variabilis TaxID=554065 RepID=E1ZNI0_CHLVA|nr:hypothetical protein CHLNCDRAFT_138668 [Chlorella variabilis]EFN52609.1 hypothetical protein CHLNCDRAFT_138668 [Chlorella variabilis]|eukprot:XP_005844711.1 hypothetical protein CHLNCDRAFT_138668 [Chlorella variabilis]